MTDKERRDKRFRKLCKWMSEAGEIAEILREECAQIEQADQQGWKKDADEYCKGIGLRKRRTVRTGRMEAKARRTER